MKSKSRKPSNLSPDINREIIDLEHGLDQIGITYDKNIIRKFQRYVEVLHEHRNRLHLLSRNDYNYIAQRHFLTSLTAFNYIKDAKNACDIGAGAGFPSLPLKIVRQDFPLTLFESKKKKVKFLRYLVAELDLPDVDIVCERAEDYRAKRFDLIVLKAVGKIKRLIKTIDKLIESKGCAIFYKSHKVENEINAAEKEIIKRRFQIEVEKLISPVAKLPLALVILKKD